MCFLQETLKEALSNLWKQSVTRSKMYFCLSVEDFLAEVVLRIQ